MTIFANCVALGVYIPFPEDDSNVSNHNLVSAFPQVMSGKKVDVWAVRSVCEFNEWNMDFACQTEDLSSFTRV